MNARGNSGDMTESINSYLSPIPATIPVAIVVERDIIEDGEDVQGNRKFRPGLINKVTLTFGGEA